MLPSTSPKEALLACPPFPSWNLPSFTVESTLSTPCPRSDPPFSRQGAALAHLDSLPPYDLVLWTDGSVSFPFGKGGSGVLANCSLCGTEATLSFSASPVCSSFFAEACANLHALCWSRHHQQVCHFSSLLLVTLVLSSPTCPLLRLSFYLKLCGRSGRNCLLSPSVLSEYNGSPDTLFYRGTTRLMSWPNGKRYLRPPQFLVVSLLLSLVSTLVIFSDWRHTVSSKFFDTQVPSISTEELVLSRHAHCVLSRLRCNGHSLLLGSYLSRIGRIENSCCSACGHLSYHSALSSYQLFAPLTLWRLSVSLRPLVQALESCPASGAPWSSAMPPSLGRGRVINNTRIELGQKSLVLKYQPETRLRLEWLDHGNSEVFPTKKTGFHQALKSFVVGANGWSKTETRPSNSGIWQSKNRKYILDSSFAFKTL